MDSLWKKPVFLLSGRKSGQLMRQSPVQNSLQRNSSLFSITSPRSLPLLSRPIEMRRSPKAPIKPISKRLPLSL